VLEKSVFIQGLFAFTGRGLDSPSSFETPALYLVPKDKRAQTVYFRAGNSSGELIYLILMRNGKTMRYFPVGAKGSMHVPLAVLEDLSPASAVEVRIGAPQGAAGTVVLDVGFMEIA
jgi:hypothetical protein